MTGSRLCSQCGTPLMIGHDVCLACAARLALACGTADGEEEEEGAVAMAGRQTVGTYELGDELGRGAMGVVFRARDRRLGRTVALKIVLAGRFASAAERQRFVLEAEAAARLEHPNVVTVYESGEADGRPYFSMRLVEGTTLAERLKGGPLPAAEAVDLMRVVALAVQHAHERGVLHRDLKPGNVLLDRLGQPHVADFGLARQVDRDMALTLAGSPLGTPGYMAPEAVDGDFSAASDVWSMGVMLYELLAGRPPFCETTLTGVLLAVREQEPPPLRPGVAGVDRDLESICLRCLEKSPSRRYRSAGALADDLERWRQGVPVWARPVTGGERLVKWVRRRPGTAALGATALVLLAAGVSGVLWQWRRANREAEVARAALLRSEESLWQANADRARALISSRAPGHRLEALTAIGAAASRRPARELRDLAIAALALPDLTLESSQASSIELPAGASVCATTGDLERVAWIFGDDVTVAATADGAEWVRLRLAGLLPDGVSANAAVSRIALVGAEGARVYALPDGAVLTTRPGAKAAALTPAGDVLFTVDGDGRIEAHSVADGRRLGGGTWAGQAARVVADATGGRVAVWRANRLAVLASPSMEVVADFENLPSAVLGVAFNPDDGTLLAGLDASGLAHFDPTARTARLVARHDREGVVPLAHPGGLLAASTAWDSTTRLSALGWDELLVVHGLRPVAFSSDGRRLLAMRDRRFHRATITLPDVWRPLPLAQLEARSTAFSPDGTRLAVAYRNALAVWDLESGRPQARLQVGDAQQVAWQPDGSLWVALTAQGLGRVTFDAGPPAVLRGPEILLDGAQGHISSFAALPGDRVATNGGNLVVWQWPERTLLRRLEANPFSDYLRRSSDGRWLAAGCWANNGRPGSFVGVWSPDQAAPVQRLPSGNADVFFSPDGRTCLVGEISGYREFDTTTWQPGRAWPRPSSGLAAARAAWSPDGSLLCLHADDTTLRLLDAASREEIARLSSPIIRRVERFEFSPDGRWLVAISSRALHVWDLRLIRARLAEMGLGW